MTSEEYVNPNPEPEHRVRQAAPDDLVQQQIRLLTIAVNDVAEAVRRVGGRTMGEKGTYVSVGHLTSRVAELGGWTESLLPIGVPVHLAENKVVIFDRVEGEEAPAAG